MFLTDVLELFERKYIKRKRPVWGGIVLFEKMEYLEQELTAQLLSKLLYS